MKKQWLQLALRIDAMQLRERVFLFVAIMIAALAIADTVWLTPAQTAYKQATQRLATQATEIERLREELKTLAQPVDPSKAVRDDIAAANLQLETINADIQAVAPLAQGGPDIEQTLVQFLRRQEGLTLLSTGTIKQETAIVANPTPTPSAAASAVTPATTAAQSPIDSTSVLSRRGLELTVSGSYPELTGYVRSLENALPALRWGTLQLKVTKATPELTMQVFVVGVSR